LLSVLAARGFSQHGTSGLLKNALAVPILLVDAPAAGVSGRGVGWVVAIDAGEGGEMNVGHVAA